MRKIAAIILLLIFLLNNGANRLLLHFYESKEHKITEISFDKRAYNQGDPVFIKILLHPFCQTHRKNFEQVYGTGEPDAKINKCITYKVCSGQLILLCLPREQQDKFEPARDGFLKITNHHNNDSNDKKPINNYSLANTFFGKYDKLNEQWHYCSYINTTLCYYLPDGKIKSLCTINMPEKPPPCMLFSKPFIS